MIDHPEIAELDINPLIADAYGVLALDARVRVTEARGKGAERLAIRPYPKEMEETCVVGDGQTLLLQPVRPEDEPALQKLFAHLTPEQIRLRFFIPMRSLPHAMAARFTQIDYDREMGLVLTEHGAGGEAPIYGLMQVSADPDNERAEYAALVQNGMSGRGLGTLLMRRMIDHCRRRGIGEVYGDVLRENAAMLGICKKLGFTAVPLPEEPNIMRVTLRLATG